LFRQRSLECEEISEFPCSGFPHGESAAEITVLFQKRQADAWLTGYNPFSRLLCSRDEPEECCLAASIPAQDRPTLSLPDGKRYSLKDSRRAKFDADIRD
jgi:hypothetical protein